MGVLTGGSYCRRGEAQHQQASYSRRKAQSSNGILFGQGRRSAGSRCRNRFGTLHATRAARIRYRSRLFLHSHALEHFHVCPTRMANFSPMHTERERDGRLRSCAVVSLLQEFLTNLPESTNHMLHHTKCSFFLAPTCFRNKDYLFERCRRCVIDLKRIIHISSHSNVACKPL